MRSRFVLAYALASFAVVVPLWIGRYLPMTDLAQHAAQVSIWQHYGQPGWDYADHYVLHLFTPYLLGYALVRLFAVFATIPVAIKLVVSLAVLALPAATLHHVRASGGDRWTVFLAFPVAFGHGFYWGFLNFILAVPLGIFLVTVGQQFAKRPTPGRGVALTFLAVVLFFAHGMVFGLAILIATALIALEAGNVRRFLVRVIPFAVCAVLVVPWFLSTRGHGEVLTTDWGLGFQRVIDFAGALLGDSADLDAAGVAIAAAVVYAVIARPRLSPHLARLAPFILALAAALLVPRRLMGIHHTGERLAVFVVPFLAAALTPNPDRTIRWRGHVLALGIALAWSATLAVRFYCFNREAAGFTKVAEHIERNRTMTAFILDTTSDFAPGQPYWHFLSWAHAERGGYLGTGFDSFNLIARPRHDVDLPSAPGSAHLFDWAKHGPFDYYLVRTDKSYLLDFFLKPPFLELVDHESPWWLFRDRRTLRPTGSTSPPEEPANGPDR